MLRIRIFNTNRIIYTVHNSFINSTVKNFRFQTKQSELNIIKILKGAPFGTKESPHLEHHVTFHDTYT